MATRSDGHLTPLDEVTAERLLARGAFVTGLPGFVGARLRLAGPTELADGRHRLRHGHLDVRAGRATLSVPPSPGPGAAIDRAAEDLALARALVAGPAVAAVRVTLDAGIAGRGPLGYRYRWTLAHMLGPVLHAIFGAPATLVAPPPIPSPGADPRTAWAATVLDAPAQPVSATGSGGSTPQPEPRTFRAWVRATAGRPTRVELDRHVEALAVPVRARGHLELDVAGALPGDTWPAALAVTAVLLDDRRAAEEATAATAPLDRRSGESPWFRAARAGLADPDLAVAARRCLIAAYAALARHGAARTVRDAVAAVAERGVPRRTATPPRT